MLHGLRPKIDLRREKKSLSRFNSFLLSTFRFGKVSELNYFQIFNEGVISLGCASRLQVQYHSIVELLILKALLAGVLIIEKQPRLAFTAVLPVLLGKFFLGPVKMGLGLAVKPYIGDFNGGYIRRQRTDIQQK